MKKYIIVSSLLTLHLSAYVLKDKDEQALTFDDVLLVPAYSSVLPKSTQLKTRLTRTITLNIPIVSSAMDTVTEARLAIAIAQEGGIGIIHKNMSIEDQVAHVLEVKRFENGIIRNPITVPPHTTIRQLQAITRDHSVSGVPVVDGTQLVGIVTNRDIRFETHLDRAVSTVMTPKEKLVTAYEGISKEEILALLHKHRVEKILIVDDEFNLRGLVTAKDINKAKDKPNACKDDRGRLRVGAAVGVDASSKERVIALVKADVDVIVVDTAHGHSQGVLDMVKWIKAEFPDLQVIAGNIATADAARALVDVGADAVKVGIGPGSICTTRVVTGVGVPQITAIAHVAQALKDTGVPLIADGGIRFSGDMCKALAAGADTVMIGNLFAGVEEAPGEIELYQGRAFKVYRGMGSVQAMAKKYNSSDRYFQDPNAKLVPEGIEGRVAYKGSLQDIVYQLAGGLRSCMGYLGCQTIEQLHSRATFMRISSAALRESHVHDVQMTKEAPNYWV